MRVAMVTWEYPPRIVGGIAPHCEGLATALTNLGHEVHIFTLDFPGTPDSEEVKGVKVHRARSEVGHPNFLTWVLLFNHFIEKQLADISQTVNFDVIHVHDWLATPSSIALKHSLRKPMVFTAHSTENGRSGLHIPDSFTIDGIEWWATYEANRIIVTSDSMKGEVCGHFHVSDQKVDVIPNAVDISKYEVPVDRWAVRARFGIQPNEKLVICVGRLVPQKGVEYLLQAVPLVSRHRQDVKFIIVGDGWYRDHLQWVANSTGQGWRIRFTGFIPDQDLIGLTKSADVLVVPSVYEPFGIVALEGMAAEVPLVVSQVGGLKEFVEHERTGVHVYPRNPESIAWGIERVLADPGYARWLVQNAKEAVKKTYSWYAIAKRTMSVYEKVVREVKK